MKLSKYFLSLILITVSLASYAAKKARTVYANDKTIKTIYLALGRSTILKFREKPTNVVVGNKNYYNVEYINNDVTIQPLGPVDTNLFVYTESKRTHALLLKIVTPNRYDDIVHIRWKSSFVLTPKRKKRKQKNKTSQYKPVDLKFGDNLNIKLERFYKLPQENSYFFEFSITNQEKSKLDVNSIQVFLTRNSKRLKNQKVIFREKEIQANKTIKARLFLQLKERAAFTLNVKYKKKALTLVIRRKYL